MLSDRKLKTTYIDARELIPDPDNVNTHSPRNEEAVRRSMLQYGIRSPIVAHEKTKIVYKGNLSLQIFLELAEQGKTESYEIPVSWIPEDTDNLVARAYGIADNRSSELSEWDILALEELVKEIDASALEIEIEDMGFDVGELDELLKDFGEESDTEVQEDDFDVDAALEVEPVSQTGDLWHLKDHRLLCGDSTVKEDVERVMDGEKADLCLTDPPYNIGYDYWGYIDKNEEYPALCQAILDVLDSHCDRLIVTTGHQNLGLWFSLAVPTHVGAWVKKNATSGCKIAMFNTWEPILFYGDFTLFRKRSSDTFEFNNARQPDVGGHSCPKQITFWANLIENYSNSGDTIYDPFLGSGTSLIASQQLQRSSYSIELSSAYIDVALKRFVKYIGTSEGVFCERNGEIIPYTELFEEQGG